jgi:hypothetical protein
VLLYPSFSNTNEMPGTMLALTAIVEMDINEVQPDESAKPPAPEFRKAIPMIEARRLGETALLQRRNLR